MYFLSKTGIAGIEPATFRLTAGCSSAELYAMNGQRPTYSNYAGYQQMGSAGSDPASLDFQSNAFTRLAYFPVVIFPVIAHGKTYYPKAKRLIYYLLSQSRLKSDESQRISHGDDRI